MGKDPGLILRALLTRHRLSIKSRSSLGSERTPGAAVESVQTTPWSPVWERIGQVNGWMGEGWMGGRVDGWMFEARHVWMCGGCVDGWMGGWVHCVRCVHV